MANVVENILFHSIYEIDKLVLKCDGMLKNKNVPKLVANMIWNKYKKQSNLISRNKKHVYSLRQLVYKLVVM